MDPRAGEPTAADPTVRRRVDPAVVVAPVVLAPVVTTLLAALDLVVPVSIAGVLAVGASIAAVSARPRVVLGVGCYAALLVLVLRFADAGSGWGTTLTDLVAVAVVAGISAVLSARRVALERSIAPVNRRHAQLAAVVDSCADGIIGLTPDGTITSWNAGAERITGRCAERAIGVRITDYVGGDARAAAESALTIIREGGTVPHYDTSRTRPDGSTMHVSVVWSPVHDADGRVTGVSAVFRDTFERETERRELQDRIRQFERLQSLGKLVGGIAHDFNNLMGIVLTYAEFVAEATADDPRASADLAHMRDAAERAAALTRHLLTFARGGSTRGELLSLNDVLAGTAPLLSRTLGGEVRLEVRPSEQPTTIRADVVHLEQVVVNLAVNARDAMPDGGLLTIETSVVDMEAEQAGLTPPPAGGSYVLLQVTDTGTGMTPEVAQHVFEPFFTTKDTSAGTGLGLSTVWGIVTDLGGSLSVRSEPGHGSTVGVYLPRVQDHETPPQDPAGAPGTQPPTTARPTTQPPTTQPPTAEPPTGPPGGDDLLVGAPHAGGPSVHRESILLVDDEDALRDLVARVLRRAGHDVVAAADGEEALRAAAGRRFDLLLTDVVMPGQSGPDVAAAVLALHPGTRVLFISGYTRGALGRGRLLEDGVDVLPKPFTTAALLERVIAALERSPSDPAPRPLRSGTGRAM